MVKEVERETQDEPAFGAVLLTPHDTNELNPYSRALYIGTGGNVNVRMIDETGSTNVLFTGVPTGTILPIGVKIVLTTNTTASTIVALY
jgi:hypothetical protein